MSAPRPFSFGDPVSRVPLKVTPIFDFGAGTPLPPPSAHTASGSLVGASAPPSTNSLFGASTPTSTASSTSRTASAQSTPSISFGASTSALTTAPLPTASSASSRVSTSASFATSTTRPTSTAASSTVPLSTASDLPSGASPASGTSSRPVQSVLTATPRASDVLPSTVVPSLFGSPVLSPHSGNPPSKPVNAKTRAKTPSVFINASTGQPIPFSSHNEDKATIQRPKLSPVPSIRTATPLSTVLDELVTIRVKEDSLSFQPPFQIYRGLLCFYSDYFRSAFLGVFKESEKKSIHLEDVDRSTFRIFMGWLHFGNFSDNHGKVGCDLTWDDILKIWVFADKHLVPLLKNEAMDLILGKIACQIANNDYFPRFTELPYIYNNTAPKSPLRRIFIDAIANYDCKALVEGEYVARCWNVESLADLSIALFDRPRMSNIVKRDIQSVLTKDRCKYHDHTSDSATHGDHDETKKST